VGISVKNHCEVCLNLFAFFMLLLFVGVNSVLAQTVIPVHAVAPTLTPVTINASAGDQYDPHVSGDWVAYTDGSGIRYYNFVTGVDAAIPLDTATRDLLSDISGSKIVFSRVTPGKTAVMVFDASTPAVAPVEVDPAPATTRFGDAIGGNTVAYIDFGLEANGELVISDLSTLTSTRVTNDTAIDSNPSVSVDGNVVVWEHCLDSLTQCDIWQAVKTGGIWTTSTVANTSNPESNPDTNGNLVLYDSQRGLNTDIFWRPVGGGAETEMLIPGVERNPSIAGDYIAFEGSAADTSDIFVYDMVTNKLYQITNTPLVNEQLNDISVLPDGQLRVVWASDEDVDTRNIRAASFTLRSTAPCQGVQSLSSLGSSLPIAPGATITQGGAPNYADTFVTPFTVSQSGTIRSWKAEFAGGQLENGGIGVPSGVQLKVLRYSSANVLEVVAAGAVHDPRPILQSRFFGYPFFQDVDSVIEFNDAGLSVQPGDIIGLTIKSDPAVGAYFYPLVSPSGTRVVSRDAGVGGTVDLSDSFTSALSWTPALQVNLSNCSPFNFVGFFQPVENLPTLNLVTAGQGVPVKFSLGGDQGLNIFAPGYPVSSEIACDANVQGSLIEETVTTGGSSLNFDAATGQYIYVWKTQKAWKGTCRMLDVRLIDGTNHFAKFRFK
jgi:Periplasmic component of the Tol biopolymer transport system